MKKIAVTLLLFTVAITGCGNNMPNSNDAAIQKEKSTNVSTSTQKAEPTEEIDTSYSTNNTISQTNSKERSLEGLEQYMLDAGYLTGERIKKAAEMIGAIDGFGYDCGVEIYQYDTHSEIYNSVAAGEEIPIQGTEDYFVKFDAVNGEFVLLLNEDQNIDQNIINTFMAY